MVAVTGGSGFLGAHLLLDLCKEGKSIVAFKRSTTNLDYVQKVFVLNDCTQLFNSINWLDVDLGNNFEIEDALNGVEEVCHCASEVSFDPREHRKMITNNVTITTNMVDASRIVGVKKFMHVSSIAALGRSTQEEIIDETRIWKTDPVNSKYALSKYKSEMEVWRAHEEGLPVIVVNPSVIMGYCSWQEGTGKMFSRVNKGLKYYTNGITGFVDVKDVSACMVGLMKSGVVGERYILSGSNLSFKEVFELIANSIGKPKAYKPVNLKLAKWLIKLEKIRAGFSGNEPLITTETLRNATLKCHYKNDKVMNQLGYEFNPIEKVVESVGQLFLKENTSPAI